MLKNLAPLRLPSRSQLKAALAASLALAVVAGVSHQLLNPLEHVVLLASMGATAVLLFGLPHSPLAKPRVVFFGHLIPATIGLLCSHWIPNFAVMAATTMGLVLLVMYRFDCMHPPGGATAMVPVIAALQAPLPMSFLLAPVLLNVLLILGVSVCLQRWLLTPSSPPAAVIAPQALAHAIASHDEPVDVDSDTLQQLFQSAQAYMRQQPQPAHCAEITRPLPARARLTDHLSSGWDALSQHSSDVLALESDEGQFVGMLRRLDFLQPSLPQHLWAWRRVLLQLHWHLTRRVSHQPLALLPLWHVPVVSSQQAISDLVPLFAKPQVTLVAVVDQGRLQGIIQASDLVQWLLQQWIFQEPTP